MSAPSPLCCSTVDSAYVSTSPWKKRPVVFFKWRKFVKRKKIKHQNLPPKNLGQKINAQHSKAKLLSFPRKKDKRCKPNNNESLWTLVQVTKPT